MIEHKPRRTRELTRRQKLAIHFALIVMVIVSLLHDGGGPADWAFVALAIACEVS